MIGNLLTTLAVLSLATAADKENSTEAGPYKPFAGIDPNELSCDPQGHIFLLLPHYSDCTKFFSCANGEEVQFQCPGGLYFNFEAQACDWPKATECWLRTLFDAEEGSGDNDELLIGMLADSLENQPVDMVASVRPISPLLGRYNGIINCNRADAAARQEPYKGDCQRYWKCIAGVPQVAFCSDGLFFNELTQQCDFEANVKCDVEQEDELQSEFIRYEQK